jgi:translation initiation factor IF-3
LTEHDPNLVQNLHQIPDEIRLVDTDDTYITSKVEVIRRINETQLDLYCINSQTNPPVYKLLDYGRYRYDQQKKMREQKKKMREQNRPIKEFKFKPQIDDHDVEVKIHHIQENIEDCDVKICMDLKRNAFVLTNRWSRTISEVVADPVFVLNRVLNTLGDSVQSTKLIITENMIYSILRKNEELSVE